MPQTTRLNVKTKGEHVKNAAIRRIIRDSLVACTFLSVGTAEKHLIGNKVVADVLTCLFWERWPAEDLVEVGGRIICQGRLFNARESMTREHECQTVGIK